MINIAFFSSLFFIINSFFTILNQSWVLRHIRIFGIGNQNYMLKPFKARLHRQPIQIALIQILFVSKTQHWQTQRLFPSVQEPDTNIDKRGMMEQIPQVWGS